MSSAVLGRGQPPGLVPRQGGARMRRLLSPALAYLQIGLLLVFFLFPIVWMLMASFKNNVQITAYPPRWLFTPTLDNYRTLFLRYPFGRYGVNSLIIVTGSPPWGCCSAFQPPMPPPASTCGHWPSFRWWRAWPLASCSCCPGSWLPPPWA
ncbi:MAG: hypothetical protein ACYDAG_12830 [Chloroflexota bacterium]